MESASWPMRMSSDPPWPLKAAANPRRGGAMPAPTGNTANMPPKMAGQWRGPKCSLGGHARLNGGEGGLWAMCRFG